MADHRLIRVRLRNAGRVKSSISISNSLEREQVCCELARLVYPRSQSGAHENIIAW